MSSLGYEIFMKLNQKTRPFHLLVVMERVLSTQPKEEVNLVFQCRGKGEYIILSMACAASLNDKITKALASLR